VPELLNDRYERLETLGVGGEARVVKALDRQHGRVVALKIRAVPDAHAREELLGEARLLLAVAPHPALPLVREDFFDGDNYVVAMDWVDGTDLATLLRDRGRPGLAPSSVLAYLAQAAEALTHLHAQDPPVIHGDVKPANLILTKGAQIKLVDFGMSSAPDAMRRRTGTPGFRAPELAADGAPSRASDVYALAATAFTLLTGSPPSGVLPGWDGFDPGQAEQLEGAIRLGLATDPARRPATPGEFVERLRGGWGAALPTGVLTFCLSDIEGSTAMWDSDPAAMAEALVRHDELIADEVEAHGGRFLKSMGEGDSTVSVFDSAPQALEAALAATRALSAERWPNDLPISARFGLHTGEAECRGADYFGPTVNLSARLRGQADGGQIFLSAVTSELVAARLPAGCDLVDLGPHRLKGMAAPERIQALRGPGVDAPRPATECPYRGLLAFEAEDREFFFGREEVVDDLLARLAPGRLVSLVGASGSGKSSVLRAGVGAAAESGEVDGVDEVHVLTPGADPPLELAGTTTHLWIVDQFEELFTLCEEAERRRAFIDALLGLPGPVVIGVRADLYGQLSTHLGLARAVADQQILLGPMTDTELRRAVTEPARLAGLRLEAGLVDLVLRDVTGEPGALPLLSHALRATWERRDGRTLTVEGYRESGGVASAVARTADTLVDSLPDEQRPLARNLFLRLTELGEGIEDTRRRERIEELVPQGASREAVQSLLERLARARLVTLGEGTAEVAHEVLIRKWPTLRRWLDEDREGIRLHRRLGNAARLWEDGGKEDSDLYGGARLATALEWTEAHPEDLNATERLFLDESRRAGEREADRQRRANRRLRGLLAGAAVLLMVAVLAGIVALVQRGNAQDEALTADAQRIGAEALAETNVDRSLLLAVAGRDLEDRRETRSDLLSVLQSTPALFRLIRPSQNDITALAARPDGRLLASGDSTGAVRFHDIRSWKSRGDPVRLEGRVSQDAMVFSPDGNELAVATATSANRANVYLVQPLSGTKRLIASLPSVPAGIGPRRFTHMDFSPDGKRIAVAVATASPFSPLPVGQRLLMLQVPSGRVVWQRRHPMRRGQLEAEVAFTPQGTVVTSAAQGDTLLWNAGTGRIERRFPMGGPFDISPNGRYAALARNNPNPGDPTTSLAVLDLRTGRHRSFPPPPARAWIISVAYTPDGKSIVTASFEGALRVWDVASGSILQTFTGQPSGRNLAVLPGGRTVVSGAETGSVAAWDLAGTQQLSRTFRWNSPDMSCVVTPCFVFNHDGTLMATSQADGTVALIDLRTRRLIDTLGAKGGAEMNALAFFPGGRRLATGSLDGRVRLWDVRARSVLRSLRFADPVPWVAVSPDGGYLAIQTQAEGSSRSRVEVREISSNRKLYSRAVRNGYGGLYFSPDGRRLAALGCCQSGSTVVVWNARSGKEEFSPRVDGLARSIAFSPDSRLLGVGTEDGKVILLNATDGTRAGSTIQAATGKIDPVSFSPDSRLLAASSGDGTTTLWDVGSRERLGRTFPVRQGTVPAAQFAPDGNLVIYGLADVAIWPMDPQVWERFSCRVAGRSLTRDEWSDVLPDRPYRSACNP
jgi:WD40 repeat protein/class 3 adenylate cyclase/energy-coupling factor transporter ATP-binding protein EcfA2